MGNDPCAVTFGFWGLCDLLLLKTSSPLPPCDSGWLPSSPLLSYSKGLLEYVLFWQNVMCVLFLTPPLCYAVLSSELSLFSEPLSNYAEQDRFSLCLQSPFPLHQNAQALQGETKGAARTHSAQLIAKNHACIYLLTYI